VTTTWATWGGGQRYAPDVPFPRQLLNEGEDVVLDLHPHWWFFAGPLTALLGSILLGVVVLAADLPAAVQVLVGVIVLFCLGWFGSRYAKWVTTNFVVTTDRLIYRHGVLAKRGIEIPLERVNTVFFGQSIWERILRSGDLVIESAGERGQQSFSNVRHPSAVQNEIYKQMEDNENRKFDRIARNRDRAEDDDADSIPGQIRELDELRRQGVLSEEEFAEKKKDLLDRM
jgi:uncharacterized membrane protein YdbT with pleckstrin-like domain